MVFQLIIFGVVSSIPEMIKEIYENAFGERSFWSRSQIPHFVGGINPCGLGYCLLTTFVTSTIQDSNPIQRLLGAPSSPYLPLVNPAGVIPVIFVVRF